jgi:hypothetical protein
MRGRKRKNVSRQPNGQPQRLAQRDKGNDIVAERFEKYGPNGADAIGRAFEAGLLGDAQDAKALLDTARAIHRSYWSIYQNGPIRCTLAESNGGSHSDGNLAREQWLNAMLDKVGPQGHTTRNAFDQLVIDHHPDSGPKWLDRLIAKDMRADDMVKFFDATNALQGCVG